MYLRLYVNHRLVVGRLKVGIHKGAERCHTHRSSFHQPCVAIDACSLVEPALLQGSVGSHADQVVAAIVHVFRHVIYLCSIAARLHTHIESVKPYAGIAENAIELQVYVFAQVLRWDVDCFSVPAHTGLRILVTHHFVAMRMAGLLGIRQRRYPVVRNVYLLPLRVVEFLCVRPLVVYRVCFRQIVKIFCAAAEVLLRVCCMSKGEFPSLSEAYGFPLTALSPCRPYRHGQQTQD